MRSLTSQELETVSYLNANDVPFALIEITTTQLTKQIIDATELFRSFVAQIGINDYAIQKFGVYDTKVFTTLVLPNGLGRRSRTSLYRAKRRGDPRFSVTGISEIVSSGDIACFIWAQDQLWILNISLVQLTGDSGYPPVLEPALTPLVRAKSEVVDELLQLIEQVAAKGFIRAPVVGSTAVGRLLESELGISMNSKNIPDFKGIEIKSSRNSKNRTSLFAKTPIWAESHYTSSRALLERFGYERGTRRKLYCQIDGHRTNSQGLRLRVDESGGGLHVTHLDSNDSNVVRWDLETLRQILATKHDETFWVSAETRMIDNWEYLRFTKVAHTKKPLVLLLSSLLADGTLSLDFTISTRNGKVTDSGYLFKILPSSLSKLFPPAQLYDLSFGEEVSTAKLEATSGKSKMPEPLFDLGTTEWEATYEDE